MGMKIQLTFKREERDLYEEVRRHRAQGAFLKDLIADSMKKKPAEKRQIQAVRF